MQMTSSERRFSNLKIGKWLENMSMMTKEVATKRFTPQSAISASRTFISRLENVFRLNKVWNILLRRLLSCGKRQVWMRLADGQPRPKLIVRDLPCTSLCFLSPPITSLEIFRLRLPLSGHIRVALGWWSHDPSSTPGGCGGLSCMWKLLLRCDARTTIFLSWCCE